MTSPTLTEKPIERLYFNKKEEKPIKRYHKSINAMERDILEMIRKGATNPEIARETKMKLSSVEVTLIRLYKKIGARNKPHAAALASRHDFYFDPADRFRGVPMKIVPKRTSTIRDFPELW